MGPLICFFLAALALFFTKYSTVENKETEIKLNKCFSFEFVFEK